MDKTILTETPPLRVAWALQDRQVRVPSTGNRDKRILLGSLNRKSGSLTVMEALRRTQDTLQQFLRQVRSHWRGWRIVLFLDRGPPHKAKRSQAVAPSLAIEQRWLPRACPTQSGGRALAASQTEVLANNATLLGQAWMDAQRYLLTMSAQERPSRAGVVSSNFWLGT